MKSIFDYPQIIERLADSLFLNIEKYDNALYSKFFIQRVQDTEFLYSRLNEVQAYGGNVLVVGEPGVGKSNFLKWFLKESQFARSVNLNNCTFLDLTTAPYTEDNHASFVNNVRGTLSSAMIAHLKQLKDPCHDAPPDTSTPAARESLYNYCVTKITNLPLSLGNAKNQIQYLFLDDVDYLPVKCFIELLEHLKPLLFSRYFCVIIACRTPAFNTIKSHRDYNVSRAFDDAKLVQLQPLAVHSILNARIQTLASSGRSLRSILKSDLNGTSLKTLFDYIGGILSGLKPEDDVDFLEYPFTEKQHAFMRMMTNGNNRQVLLMAKEYLHYMRTHIGDIKKEEQGYWVGRRAVITHFTKPDIDSKIRIINLHQKKTFQYTSADLIKKKGIPAHQVGNSTNIVLLETFKHFKYPNHLDSQYYQLLGQEYGLSKDDIREGIADLLDYGMTTERLLEARPALGSKQPFKDYDLTEKGACYLDYLIHWDEYIEKYGLSRHHELFRTFETKQAIEAALLEFLINILVVKRIQLERKAIDTIKIAKGPFRSQFCKLNRDLIRHLDPTDKLTSHELSQDEMAYYLTTRLQLLRDKPSENEAFFELKPESIEAEAARRKLPIALKGIYDAEGFGKYVKTFVK